MHVHDRVIIHIGHPDTRVNLLGDLMHIARCRDASTDIDDLPDAGLVDEVPHRALHERPVLLRHIPGLRHCLKYCRRGFPVDHIVVFARR